MILYSIQRNPYEYNIEKIFTRGKFHMRVAELSDPMYTSCTHHIVYQLHIRQLLYIGTARFMCKCVNTSVHSCFINALQNINSYLVQNSH